jgi:hypothetical protein
MPRRETQVHYEGYENPWRGLALAVIAQAVQDARLATPHDGRRVQALHFLHSRWAEELALACDLPEESWRALLMELDEKIA